MVYQRISIQRLERIRLPDGSTLHFCIPGTDRQHLASFLSPEEVPAFVGEVAYFEMKWHRKGVWMGYSVVRQVEPSPEMVERDERKSHLRYRRLE